MTSFEAFREQTGWKRPGRDHGCRPVEIIPGVWTAHYHDIEDEAQLRKAAPSVTVVVNAGTDKCPSKPGTYGDKVEVMLIDGLLDDPDPLKKVCAMDEGPEKEAARAALPSFPDAECAGDAYKDFERVSAKISATSASGGERPGTRVRSGATWPCWIRTRAASGSP